MILPALLSITFRKLPAEEVVRLAAANGIRAIEWGGDIHAPHRDMAALVQVRDLTRAAGLSVCAYGSYYRIGETDPAKPGFTEVLTAAKVLGAPIIRVWVGQRGSAEVSVEERAALVAEARRIADEAQGEGVIVASEWHGGTITDVEDSALDLQLHRGRRVGKAEDVFVQGDHAARLGGLLVQRHLLDVVTDFAKGRKGSEQLHKLMVHVPGPCREGALDPQGHR